MACDKKDNAMADDMIRVTYRIECAGDVEAMTRLGVGAFENGAAVGSANAVGNSALLSNFGADAYAGVGQVNELPRPGQVVLQPLRRRNARAAPRAAPGNASSPTARTAWPSIYRRSSRCGSRISSAPDLRAALPKHIDGR